MGIEVKKLSVLAVVAATTASGLGLVPTAHAGPATGNVTVGTEYGSVLRNTFRQNVDGSGYSWKTYGSSNCTVSTSSPDSQWADMNTRSNWGDAASYAYDYNQCDTKLFRLTDFNDALTGYVHYGSSGQSLEGAGLNNKTSSFYLS